MSVYKGKSLTIELFGASHAEAVGVKMLGYPAQQEVDITQLRAFLDRRKPGSGDITSARREPDEPIFLSGIESGVTNGSEIISVIKNKDVRREDYVNHIPRPGHADLTAWIKYGIEHDMSGGGEFSGRMTAPLCVAGGICLQYLARHGISVSAKVITIGGKDDDFEGTIRSAKADGDSVGGIIECVISGVPAGIGGELFDGLESRISQLIFAIPAVKGIEFGAGFKASKMRGSQHNDAFILSDGVIVTESNNHGGILGGITSGMPVVFRTAIKPTPSIAKPQRSVDMDTMQPAEIAVSGRHDPCIVPRAVPVIEAAAAIAFADLLISDEKTLEIKDIRSRIDRIDRELTFLFTERMELCEKIGEYKKAHSLPTCDPVRESEKLASVRELAGEKYADEIEELYRHIFGISREYQERIK